MIFRAHGNPVKHIPMHLIGPSKHNGSCNCTLEYFSETRTSKICLVTKYKAGKKAI